jgi:hypothetical protein
MFACVFDGSSKGFSKKWHYFKHTLRGSFMAMSRTARYLAFVGFEVHINYVEILHVAVTEHARYRGVGRTDGNRFTKPIRTAN